MKTMRLGVLGLGAVLTALLGSTALWDLVRGAPVFDGRSYPDAARLSLGLLIAGVLMMAAAWTGARTSAGLLAASTLPLVGCALAVNAADGDPLSPLWRPVLVGLCALVPAVALFSATPRARRASRGSSGR